MNTEPSLASTFVPWTVNGPTALPHDEALAAVDPASPSGMISTRTSSGASTSAAPRARPRQLNRESNRHPGRQPPRPEPAGVMGPFHAATGKLPPVSVAAGLRRPIPLSGEAAGYGLVA